MPQHAVLSQPERPSADWRRLLLHFVVLGGLLQVVVHALAATPEPPIIHVAIAADAGGAERQRAVDDALLLELACRSGWHETDRIVVDRLVRTMAKTAPDAPPSERLRQAYRLNLHRSDPLTRARLIQRADVAIMRTLRAPLETAPEASEPVFYDVHHRFFRTLADAEAGATTLRAGTEVSGHSLPAVADPFAPLRVTRNQLFSRFGSNVADEVHAAAAHGARDWRGPLASPLGFHLVRVLGTRTERGPGVPGTALKPGPSTPGELQPRPSSARDARRAVLDALRRSFRVVEREPSP